MGSFCRTENQVCGKPTFYGLSRLCIANQSVFTTSVDCIEGLARIDICKTKNEIEKMKMMEEIVLELPILCFLGHSSSHHSGVQVGPCLAQCRSRETMLNHPWMENPDT